MKYEIGLRIRQIRESRNMLQKDFAALIGVSNNRVSNWEQGLNRPDVDILAHICTVLDVSANELLDIRLSETEFSDEERQVIMHYRSKPELQQAVRILLGMPSAD